MASEREGHPGDGYCRCHPDEDSVSVRWQRGRVRSEQVSRVGERSYSSCCIVTALNKAASPGLSFEHWKSLMKRNEKGSERIQVVLQV